MGAGNDHVRGQESARESPGDQELGNAGPEREAARRKMEEGGQIKLLK